MFISSFRQCLLHVVYPHQASGAFKGRHCHRKSIYVHGSWKSLWGQVSGEAFGGDEHVRFKESPSFEQLSSSVVGSTYSFRCEINFSECREAHGTISPQMKTATSGLLFRT